MTRQEFIDKHSEAVIDLYDELQLKWQYDHAEPGSLTMWVDPEDDPRLDNVREILSALITERDRLEWDGQYCQPKYCQPDTPYAKTCTARGYCGSQNSKAK